MDFLERLRGKKLVFVGDLLNRNMWEFLVCIFYYSIKDKRRVYEIFGKREFKKEGFYVFRFEVCFLFFFIFRKKKKIIVFLFYIFIFLFMYFIQVMINMQDYNCIVDYVRVLFLVREFIFKGKNGLFLILRFDLMDKIIKMYRDVDVIIFNIGYWWIYEKIFKGLV